MRITTSRCRRIVCAGLGAAAVLLSGYVQAEATSIKIGRSFSVGHLPAMVMEEYKSDTTGRAGGLRL